MLKIKNKIDWKSLIEMPGSKKISAKKILLLNTALRIISTQGVGSLSVTALASETGMSKSLVIYHYDSNEKIFEDLAFYFKLMGVYFLSGDKFQQHNFEKRITTLVSSLFEWILFNQEVADFFVLMFHQKTNTEINKFILDHWEKALLESMKYRSMNEVKTFSSGAYQLTYGSLITLISNNDIENYRQYLATIKVNLERLLDVDLPVITL